MKGISDLPFELLTRIGQLISAEDIISLRQTSIYVSTGVDDAFAYHYFQTRLHLYTQHSMEALYKISSIHKLRKKLKRIEIYIPDEHLYNLPLANALGTEFQFLDASFPGQKLTILEDHRKYVKEKIRLDVFNLLKDSLRNLAGAGVVPHVMVHPYDSNTHFAWSLYGLKTLSRLPWVPNNSPPTQRSELRFDVAARIAVKAIAQAQFPAHSLDLCGWPCEDAYFFRRQANPWFALAFGDQTQAMLVSALSPSLRSLSVILKLEDLVKPPSNGQSQALERGDHPVGRFLSACPNLVDLALVYQPKFTMLRTQEVNEQYGSLLNCWLAGCKLQSLRLRTGAFWWKDLRRLLESQRCSLHKLSLIGISLEGLREWKDCFNFVIRGLDLTRCDLKRGAVWEKVLVHTPSNRLLITTDRIRSNQQFETADYMARAARVRAILSKMRQNIIVDLEDTRPYSGFRQDGFLGDEPLSDGDMIDELPSDDGALSD